MYKLPAVRRPAWIGRRVTCSGGPDDGGAIVEFLGTTVLLLVPLVYLVLALSRIQAGAYAAELAATEAARGALVAGVSSLDHGSSVPQAVQAAGNRAAASAGLTLEDFAFDPSADAVISVSCTSNPCFLPGSDVLASVDVEVGFPGVPSFVRGWLPLSVTIHAEASSPVDGFASGQ